MKKLISLILAILMLASLATAGFAALEDPGLVQVTINVPEINVVLTGTEYSSDEISAKLGDEELELLSVENYDPQKHSTLTYMLVDVSATMSSYVRDFRESIKSYAEQMGEHDRLILVIFGTDNDIIYDSDNETDDLEASLSEIICNEAHTYLYKNLQWVLKHSAQHSENYDRSIAVVFSDGKDDQADDETGVPEEMLEDHHLPMYFMCTDSRSNDSVGGIFRSSGGKVITYNSDGAMENLYKTLEDTSILKLKTKLKKTDTDGSTRLLRIEVNGFDLKCQVSINNAKDDEIPPQLDGEPQFDSINNKITLRFTEPVSGADAPSAYLITNADGKEYRLQTVDPDEENSVVHLIPIDTLYNGTYTIVFKGIVDDSDEKNLLVQESVSFEVTDVEAPTETTPTEPPTQDPPPAEEETSIWIYVGILIGLMIMVAIVVVIILVSKRNAAEHRAQEEAAAAAAVQDYQNRDPQMKHHIMAGGGARVVLRVKTGNSEQRVETTITCSLIVGRSSMCDLFIDDAKLSRQHFAIEREENDLFIADLNSRNGTFLNGTRVYSRQKLHDGDKIAAGLSDIQIRFTW